MPLNEGSMSAMVLTPIRSFQFLACMIIFHLGSFMESIPQRHMALTTCYGLMLVAFTYIILISTAMMVIREGDVIQINWVFVSSAVGIPTFILTGIICYALPSTNSKYWAVKVNTLVCCFLAAAFLIDILTVLRWCRRSRN